MKKEKENKYSLRLKIPFLVYALLSSSYVYAKKMFTLTEMFTKANNYTQSKCLLLEEKNVVYLLIEHYTAGKNRCPQAKHVNTM